MGMDGLEYCDITSRTHSYIWGILFVSHIFDSQFLLLAKFVGFCVFGRPLKELCQASRVSHSNCYYNGIYYPYLNARLVKI